jgi:hypothetical protein
VLVEFAQLVAAAAPAEVMDVSHWLLLDMSVNGARRREACNLSSSHLASQKRHCPSVKQPVSQSVSFVAVPPRKHNVS